MKTFFEANYDDILKAFAELGIDVKDPNNGNYRLFSDVINDLAEKWNTIEEEDKESLRKTFNKEE